LVHCSVEEGRIRKDVGEISESSGESFRVPGESIGGEFGEGVDLGDVVESSEVTKIPETSREFDEVGSGPVERVEDRESDMSESVFECDYRV
jgi:hypothetical protein